MAMRAAKRRKVHIQDQISSSDSFSSFSDEDEGHVDLHNSLNDGDLDTSNKNLQSGAKSPAKTNFDNAAIQNGIPSANGHDSKQHQTSTRSGGPDDSQAINAFRSQPKSFKAGVEDMLKCLRLTRGTSTAKADETIRQLKTIIENIPPQDPLPVNEAEHGLSQERKVVMPFPVPKSTKGVQYKLGYDKPSYINVIGSYALKTMTKTDEKVCIDMVVFLPNDLLTEKDYLDYRFLHKKTYYLAYMAAGIQESKEREFNLKFSYLGGNRLQPVLIIRPEDDIERSSRFQYEIRIIPAASDGILPLQKTLPGRCSIRAQDGKLTNGYVPPATPFYNASVRADLSHIGYLKLLHGATAKTESFADACIMGRRWLDRRGFASSIQQGGFGNFEWSALLALLMVSGGSHGRPLFSTSYDKTQLFSAMLQLLATRDLVKQPMHLRKSTDIDLLTDDGIPMFFDESQGLNILFKMSPWSYKSLQKEARLSAKVLGRSSLDQFDNLFSIRTDTAPLKYDVVVQIPLRPSKESSYLSHCESSSLMGKLYKVLSQGLGDRVESISIRGKDTDRWLISTKADPKDTSNLDVGLVLNPVNASRTIDRGPPAEEKDRAALFRGFWGDRAELRRFKDGTILESVIWSDADSAEPVLAQIIRYLLIRHFNAESAQGCTFLGFDYEKKILPDGTLNNVLAPELIRETFRKLETDMRALEGFPLHIRQMLLASYDYSLVGQHHFSPSDVVLQFEGTGRWPDDLDALYMTKAALLLKLAEMLQQAVPGVEAQVGLENEHLKTRNRCFLDVKYPQGSEFRIRILHDREQELIERKLKDDSLGGSEKNEVANSLAEQKRVFLRRPLHTQAMIALTTQFAAFLPTLEFLKAWFDSHLLSLHFAPELIEIFAARTFLHPAPWPTPSSPMMGFLRSLEYLSRWDWQNEPLIVDFSGVMKASDRTKIGTRLEAWRKIDPLFNRVSLIVATSNDPEGTMWTEHKPVKPVAGRMSSLAKAAFAVVSQNRLDMDPLLLFKSPLTTYDFVLHLSPRFTRKGSANAKALVKSPYKNLQLELPDRRRFAELSAAKLYVDELQVLYSEAILFFYDASGGDVVAGIWNPQTARRRWKVHLGYSSTSVAPTPEDSDEDERDAVINKDAILEEIVRLGDDMIVKLQINR